MARMTKARLVAAGNELQVIMKYKGDDKFNPKAKDDDMKDWIENASSEIEPQDKLSDELVDTLTDLGFWTEGTHSEPDEEDDVDEKPAKPEKSSKKKSEKEPEPEEEDDDDDIEEIIEKSNLKELKALVKKDERFSELKAELKDFDDAEELKDEMFDILDTLKEEKESKEKPEKSSKKKEEKEPEPEDDEDDDDPKPKKESKKGTKRGGFSRIDAVCEALQKGKSKTIEDLAEKADEIYEEKGGKSNLKETKDDVKRALRVLVHFEDDLKIKLPNS